MAQSNTSTKVVTDEVRLSYAFVWEAREQDEGDAKYSCVLLIPKNTAGGKATKARIDAAIKAAAELGKNSKFDGKIPANLATTIYDGDEDADLEDNPEYAGHWYMNVSSKTRPGIVDANVNPILDSTEVYSGCYARVAIGAFPYNYKGKKGVSFGLDHIQKLRDGESLGGRSRAEDVFESVEVDDESVI